jgi:hypothetical protein
MKSEREYLKGIIDEVKQFLGLDWRKIVLFIVLFKFVFPLIDVLFLPQFISLETMGFPFTYYTYHVMMPFETAVFRPSLFILDVLICYIISCFIINKTLKYRVRRGLLDYITLGLVIMILAYDFVRFTTSSAWIEI